MTKPVTLTFDNGPHPDITPRVLDILAARNILSTFFVLGENIADPACREIAERARNSGHRIGNHTYSHAGPIGLDAEPDAPDREIGATQRLLGGLASPERFFRPCGGGGKLNADLFRRRDRRYLMEEGYSVVLWTAVPGDWNDPNGWVERALEMIDAQDWPLVVLHDVPGACIGRLENFLEALEARGIEFRQEFPPECVPMVGGKIVDADYFDTLVSA